MKYLQFLLTLLVAVTFSSCMNLQQTGNLMLENSLGKWKATDFAGHGEVSVEKGVLKIGMGIELTGVTQ